MTRIITLIVRRHSGACINKAILLYKPRKMKLRKTIEAINFNEMRPDILADYIVNTHHLNIKKALQKFEVQLKTILKIDSEKHPQVIEVDELMRLLKSLMEQHLVMEERFLFPYIRKLFESASGNQRKLLENPINKLKLEHLKAQALLKSIRRISGNYTPPPQASPALKLCYAQLFDFEQDIQKHIFLEEGILFPKLLQLEKQFINRN
jgi:regulator of cell morphogenesis and NO signaling